MILGREQVRLQEDLEQVRRQVSQVAHVMQVSRCTCAQSHLLRPSAEGWHLGLSTGADCPPRLRLSRLRGRAEAINAFGCMLPQTETSGELRSVDCAQGWSAAAGGGQVPDHRRSPQPGRGVRHVYAPKEGVPGGVHHVQPGGCRTVSGNPHYIACFHVRYQRLVCPNSLYFVATERLCYMQRAGHAIACCVTMIGC